MVLAALLGSMLIAGVAAADNNPNGMAFRAVGWFKGKGEISAGSIKCEVPTITSAINEGAFEMGLWNTYGEATLYFPNINGAFADPCGGWIQLTNNLLDQAIAVTQIRLKYKIPGAKQFRQFVPTKNGFPIACKQLQKATLFVGSVVNPFNSPFDTSGSGAPNVTFIEVLPLVSTQLFNCLRSQYAPLSTDVYSSLPLVIRATVVGTSDAGDTYTSNTAAYTLTLRHTCGNGRIDDGEFCDPATPFASCLADTCVSGVCGLSGRPCAGNIDCAGTCVSSNSPSECVCAY